MSRKSKRHVLATLNLLMERPKWWNEAFAKYDQKSLHTWAANERAKVLESRKPHLDIPETSLSDRIAYKTLYQPYATKNNQRFVA